MASMIIIVVGLASICFLSAVLFGFALMMRGQWDKLGDTLGSGRDQSRGPHYPH